MRCGCSSRTLFAKHGQVFDELGVNPNNGIGSVLRQDPEPAGVAARADRARYPRLLRIAPGAGDGRFGEGHLQPARAQRRDRRCVDAGDDPRRGQDVGAGRQAEGRQGGDAGQHLRPHLPGVHQLLQDQRRLRSDHHGHGAERRPDGPAGRGIRLARQDLRDPGRRGGAGRRSRRHGAARAERRAGRHLADVPDQGRCGSRLGQAGGDARPALEHAGGVLARRIPRA